LEVLVSGQADTVDEPDTADEQAGRMPAWTISEAGLRLRDEGCLLQ
jgi:hypothetical protein